LSVQLQAENSDLNYLTLYKEVIRKCKKRNSGK